MRAQKGVNVDKVEKALSSGDLEGAMAMIPWAKLDRMEYDITPELRSVLNKAAAAEARNLLPRGIDISFNQTNPEAIRWITDHCAELVTNVTQVTKDAIRTIITRSFDEGIPPIKAARMIREHIGILPKHANAVVKFRASLEQKLDTMTPAEMDARAGRYAKKLLNYRAKMISRNELLTAANEGQNMLWTQAVEEDLIDTSDLEREWIADQNEKRTCPICRDLDGKRAPIGGLFKSALTPDGCRMPPRHVMCRCSTGLSEIKKPE
jgi:hypothetical protein